MFAAYNGQAECARLLLEAGADASLRATGGDWEGKTALELAEEEGEAEVAALLAGKPLAEYFAQLSQEAKDNALGKAREAAKFEDKPEALALLEGLLSGAEKVEWEKTKAEIIVAEESGRDLAWFFLGSFLGYCLMLAWTVAPFVGLWLLFRLIDGLAPALVEPAVFALFLWLEWYYWFGRFR